MLQELIPEHYLNGRYKCLETTPSFECGNGVLDPGEACDCGAIDCSSSDPCCDGKTCQLVSGAACSDVASAPAFAPLSRAVFDTVDADALASQTCCQSCQIKAKGTTCRAARENDQCDVAETATAARRVLRTVAQRSGRRARMPTATAARATMGRALIASTRAKW